MELEFDIGDYLEAAKFYESLPSRQRRLFDLYPPGSRWRLKVGSPSERKVLRRGRLFQRDHRDWFVPIGYTSKGDVQVVRIDGKTSVALIGQWDVAPLDLISAEQ